MRKKTGRGIASWSLRSQLIAAFFLFAVVPSLCIYASVMSLYREDLMRAAVQNVHSVLQTDNLLIDTVLGQVEDVSYTMVGNNIMYNSFSVLSTASPSQYPQLDRDISYELAKQFGALDIVYETSFYTPQRMVAQDNNRTRVSIQTLEDTNLLEMAEAGNGQPYWLTGYDFGQYFSSSYLQEKGQYEYRYLLTMAREMNFQHMESTTYQNLPDGVDPPVLIVHVLENDLRALYSGSVEYEGTVSFLVNEQGVVLSSDSELLPIGTPLPQPLEEMFHNREPKSVFFEDTDWLFCREPLRSRGWNLISLVPMKQVVQATQGKITMIHIIVLTITLLGAVLLAVVMGAAITRPIGALIAASRRVSQGDFSANTPLPRGKDLRLLTENFNSMEKEINRLITENYAIALREKDAQLTALSMQINPHFLYNTLNTVNMLAIEHDEDTISDVIVNLSEMLQYAFRNHQRKVPLQDELQWVEHYVSIMQKRYENVFSYHASIQQEASMIPVPKFFLQPLVENAILHGFCGRTQGGVLTVSASLTDAFLTLSVKDNGVGMTPEQCGCLLTHEKSSEHIGIANVHQRLRLIYGEAYEMRILSEKNEGTEIIIRLPL